MPLKDDVMNELKTVNDPELGVNIVDLGLVYEVEERSEKDVFIKLTLTSPACPLGPQIIDEIKQKLSAIGLTAEIEITFNPPWGPDMMSEDAKFELGIMG